MKLLLTVFSLTIFYTSVIAQTCCSGGVPISSNLGFASSDKNTLQYSISYDLNTLSQLFTEGERIDDDLRKRTTHSYLFRAHYSFSDRFSVEGLFSLVNQRRKIYDNQGDAFTESSFGLGDPVLLLLYNVLNGNLTWTIGAGPQIPMGATDRRNSRGLLMIEDLQPGSGAWDGIFFSSIQSNLPRRPSLVWYTNFIYSLTGANQNSRGGNFRYEFGNDLQIIAGITDQILIFNQVLTPGFGIRYRNANQDRINDNLNPGTGGEWLFAKVSLAIPIKTNTNFNISYERAISTKVIDTQLSPTFILNIGFNQSIQTKKTNTNILIQ